MLLMACRLLCKSHGAQTQLMCRHCTLKINFGEASVGTVELHPHVSELTEISLAESCQISSMLPQLGKQQREGIGIDVWSGITLEHLPSVPSITEESTPSISAYAGLETWCARSCTICCRLYEKFAWPPDFARPGSLAQQVWALEDISAFCMGRHQRRRETRSHSSPALC